MDLQSYFNKVDESVSWLKKNIKVIPQVVVVLSGGLGEFSKDIDGAATISSSDIPHFPVARAEGHSGKIIFGKKGDVSVAVLMGRYHYYEGHEPQTIVFPYFALAGLGAKTLICTNATGGINKSFMPGDIMLITDHINMMGINPLIGLAVQKEVNQFTSLTNAYDSELCNLAEKTAKGLKIELKKGVYAATNGPSYETKAETKMLRLLGVDAVGMSTVPEVIVANFLEMKVLAFSCIANPAADLHGGQMSHSEVLAAMNKMAPKMVQLLNGIVEKL